MLSLKLVVDTRSAPRLEGEGKEKKKKKIGILAYKYIMKKIYDKTSTSIVTKYCPSIVNCILPEN
jgi:hypothetical protein